MAEYSRKLETRERRRWIDGWNARGAVAELASRTQRRYPASVPGRITDECVEAGFVARGEGAALEFLERWGW
jgi:hypothetical protein